MEFIENYQARSVIVSARLGDVDVFCIVKENESIYVNYLMVQNGTIVQRKTVKVEAHLEENIQEILAFTIGHFRTTFCGPAKEIITPFEIDYAEEGVLITVPKGGEKK